MIWQLLKKDLLRRYKNPLGFIVLIILPLVLVGLMGLVFAPSNNNNVLQPIKLQIEDHDQSFLSKMLPGAFGSDQLASMFDVQPVDSGKGRAMMDAGKASALLIIPEDFGADVFDGKPTKLILIKNPGEAFSPKIAEETVFIFAEGLDRLFRLAEEPLSAIRENVKAQQDITDAETAQISIMFSRLIRQVEVYLFPPLITLEKAEADNEQNQSNTVNIFGYILAGVMVMSLFFVLDNVAKDIFVEQENRTLYRIKTSPASLRQYALSKMLSTGLVGLLSHFLVWALGSLIFQIHFAPTQLFRFIVFSFVILFSLTALILFLYTVLRSRSQASAIIPIIVIFFSMVGGSMIPVNSLPDFIQKMAVVSPVYWAVNGLQKVVIENADLGAIQLNTLILGSAAVALTIVSQFLLNRKLAR